MKWDIRLLAIGIAFLIGSAISGYTILTTSGRIEPYYITGLLVFAVVGIGFLKKAKK
ncbi:MAG: hypothetical protein RR313_02035 [Anaerovoracaceae bacterium]